MAAAQHPNVDLIMRGFDALAHDDAGTAIAQASSSPETTCSESS